MANYLTVGYMEDGKIVELGPKRKVRVVDAVSGKPIANIESQRALVDEAISYYQGATNAITQTSRR
jgi:hypothetical protein